VTATYDSKRAAGYESMGIMIAYMAYDGPGTDPFKQRLDWPGRVTHGHLPENDNHGGGPTDLPDARKLADGVFAPGPIDITGFTYRYGDLALPGERGRPPVVRPGQSLDFVLSGQDNGLGIYHSVTSCKAPCNRSTGIAYPLADGTFDFDSGQLGDRTPAVGRMDWKTPKSLPQGTYTYFCRIHPSMRGAFRVKK
jgi:plastocyanin